MMPDKRWQQDWPILSLLMMTSKEVYENMNHKAMLALGVAIISAMIYWGFSRTFSQMDKIELRVERIGERQIEVIKNQGDLKTQVMGVQQQIHDHIEQAGNPNRKP